MNLLKAFLVAALLLANLVWAPPSWADRPKITKTPEYIEVTKTLNNLSKLKEGQSQAVAEEVQKKIDELEFQKYILESGVSWGQCRNETGKTLGVYGPTPGEDDDAEDYSYDSALYFLADGQTTQNNWDCEGVYLPTDVTTTGITSNQRGGQELGGPVAVKIPNGTQLVVKVNPDTAAVEFSSPPTKVFQAGEVNWFIPNVSQALIDARVPDAPTSKS